MGKMQRDKGNRVERELNKYFQDNGFFSKKVPLSGAVEHYKGDLILKLMEKEYQIEVKARKDGFKTIHQFLKSNDILALKANNKPFLLVFEIDKFIEIVKEYQNGCNQQLSTVKEESN